MKKLLLIIFIYAGITTHAQNILRVNNRTIVNAPYRTISDAISVAGANDIIMVEGSPDPYDALVVNKKVTIVGPGYFLNENLGLQVNVYPVTIPSIELKSGASGTSLSGLTMNTYLSFRQFSIEGASNITITNCRIIYGFNVNGSGSNVVFKENHISGYGLAFNYDNSNPSNAWSAYYNNVLIANNVFAAGIYGVSITPGQNSFFTVTNNTFYCDNGNLDFRNAGVSNNIFTGTDNFPNLSTAMFEKNALVATQASAPGSSSNNTFGISASSLFIGLPGNTTDSQWKLKAGSPAIGAGFGNVDCGAFGGISPYKISGIKSNQPTITSISTPGNVSQNGTLNVKVSAKVN